MPDDGMGSFDGGGSVRWEVVVDEDDDRKGHSTPHGDKGRRTSGCDRRPSKGKYFRIVMKVPTAPEARRAFLRQFNVPETRGEIEVRLPLERVDQQIKVKWDADGWLPPVGSTGA